MDRAKAASAAFIGCAVARLQMAVAVNPYREGDGLLRRLRRRARAE